MLIQEYSEFVNRTDWTCDRDPDERRRIAEYGIAAETGSLVSAVKKKLLAPSDSQWDEPNEEITEELGDILWYTGMFAAIDGGKAIHSEGERIAGGDARGGEGAVRLFTSKEQIPFVFLKLIRSFVKGLEVAQNQFWEWREAIVESHQIYAQLYAERQGTVSVDLEKRAITFEPHVAPALKGTVVGTGIGQADTGSDDNQRLSADEKTALGNDPSRIARLLAQKKAILSALRIASSEPGTLEGLKVTDLASGEVSVKAFEFVQEAIWEKGAISFQTVDVPVETGVLCYAIALGDVPR